MPTTPHLSEEARIKDAYQRRAREVPKDRYALHRPAGIALRAAQLEHVARALLDEGVLPFEGRSILEVGCGYGQWLVDFETMGARRSNLAGIDLDPARVEVARARLSTALDGDDTRLSGCADLRVGSAAQLPWPSRRFDIVFQSTVFTSILDTDLRRAVAAEMLRVLRSGGLILWYDFCFDNPRNPDVRGIGRRAVASLFPGCKARFRRVTLAPPLGRWLASKAPEAVMLLERLKILNTHDLVTLRPTAEGKAA